MRNFLQLSVSVLIALLGYEISDAQGPITPTEGFVGKTEIAVVWENSGMEEGSNVTFSHNIFKLRDDHEVVSDPYQRFNVNTSSHPGENHGNFIINGVSADFNGDSKSEYLVLSHGENGTIHFSFPGIKELTADTFRIGVFNEGPLSVAGNALKGNILAEAGDFNNDGKAEMVLAWADELGEIQFSFYALNESGDFFRMGGFSDQKLAVWEIADLFAIHVADLDEDMRDELIMNFYSDDPQEGIYLNVYRFTDLQNFTFKKTRQLLDNDISFGFFNQDKAFTLDVTSGDFDGDNTMEVAAGFSTLANNSDLYVFPVEMEDDPSTPENDPLERINFDKSDRFHFNFNWNGVILNLVSGDVNNNGREEIVASAYTNFLLYTEEENSLRFVSQEFEYAYGSFLKNMEIKNIDNQPENGKEILFLNNISSDFILTAFSVNESYQIETLAKYSFNTWGKNPGTAVMVTGDFDGDVFRIGPGKKYNKTDIVQPLVILNAPPTHFDMIDGEIYDVNECHNNSSCQSYANYTATSSSNISVSTTLRESWGVSSTLKGGGKVLGFGVEAYLTGNYGKNFEKTTGSSETVVIQQSVTATFDDQIYATVCDYEIWEYVVYDINNRPAGNIITLKPLLTENRWFPSKERSASGYIPKHEVGNILSYTPYKDLNNPDGDEKIRGSYGSDSYDLDANTDVTFSVNLSNTFNNSVVEEREIGVEVGGSVSKWGIEVSGSASYDRSDLSTHSISIGEALDITVHLGGINRSIGETGYNVTPYIYWGTNGALVIDYAARPILPEPGGTETWWSETYHTADPAFILPWRLDPEKGLILQDEEKRERTKSITFSPAEPEEGDTVTVTAVVSNFSPYPTAGSIPVSFYIGHPQRGGLLIKDINGNSLFQTPGVIEAQGHQRVSFKWIVPENLTSFPRIYGYIDPLNSLQEIHDANNIGWVILGKSDEGGVTGSEEWNHQERTQNSRAFPNPFNDQTVLEFELKEISDVSVEVYDMTGKRIFSMFENDRLPGTYQQIINGEDLKPGMYIYRINSREFSESGRIMKTR